MKNTEVRRHLKARRAEAESAARRLAKAARDGSLPDADLVALDDAFAEVEHTGRALRAFKAPKVSVKSEPRTYRQGGPHSWFRDLLSVRSTLPLPGSEPEAARARLIRNNRESAVLREAAVRRGRAALEAEGVRSGDLDAITAGSGAEFVPPVWILEAFASVARSAAPLRQIFRRLPLPDGTLELHVPRFDTAAGPVPESAENTSPAAAIQAPTDAIVTKVACFAGDSTVSLQLFERGPRFDDLVAADFGEAYAAALESQLVNGTGTNGQLLGLLNVPTTSPGNGVPGAVQVTYTASSPTPTGFIQAIGQTAAQVADARDRPPSALLMRPARYYWLAATPDGSTNEPTMRPGTGETAPDPDNGWVGPIAGLPTYLDGSIPADLGGGTNEDTVLVVRGQDHLLLEGQPIFGVVEDGSGLAENLTMALVFHVYVASIPNRYPESIGSLTGTGCVVQSGW